MLKDHLFLTYPSDKSKLEQLKENKIEGTPILKLAMVKRLQVKKFVIQFVKNFVKKIRKKIHQKNWSKNSLKNS